MGSTRSRVLGRDTNGRPGTRTNCLSTPSRPRSTAGAACGIALQKVKRRLWPHVGPCPDLVVDQVSKGLAHVYNVDDSPSKPEYVRAQIEAQKAERGMWAKGVPEFILTSTHSAAEGLGDKTYNRLISTRDGHTEKWKHQETYRECQWVCAVDHNYDEEALDAAAARMRADSKLGPLLADFYNFHLKEFAARYLRKGEVPEYVPRQARSPLQKWLAREKKAGRLGSIERVKGSCMIFAEFERRYGNGRASCVRGKGNF